MLPPPRPDLPVLVRLLFERGSAGWAQYGEAPEQLSSAVAEVLRDAGNDGEPESPSRGAQPDFFGGGT